MRPFKTLIEVLQEEEKQYSKSLRLRWRKAKRIERLISSIPTLQDKEKIDGIPPAVWIAGWTEASSEPRSRIGDSRGLSESYPGTVEELVA